MFVGEPIRDHLAGEQFFRMDGSPLPLEELATSVALRTGRPASLP